MMEKKVEIRETKVLSDERYPLKLVRYALVAEDGTEREQKREIYDHGSAVTALLYNIEKRTVILTRQFRLPTFLSGNASGMLTEACAGLVEEGETPEETMRREIEEETGYVIGAVEKLYEAYTSPGFSTEKVHFYLASYRDDEKKKKGGGLAEEGEDIEVLELPFDQAFRQLEQGLIGDVKAIVLLQALRLRGVL